MRLRTLSSRFFSSRRHETNTSEWSEEMGNEKWNQESSGAASIDAREMKDLYKSAKMQLN